MGKLVYAMIACGSVLALAGVGRSNSAFLFLGVGIALVSIVAGLLKRGLRRMEHRPVKIQRNAGTVPGGNLVPDRTLKSSLEKGEINEKQYAELKKILEK